MEDISSEKKYRLSLDDIKSVVKIFLSDKGYDINGDMNIIVHNKVEVIPCIDIHDCDYMYTFDGLDVVLKQHSQKTEKPSECKKCKINQCSLHCSSYKYYKNWEK